VEEVKANYAFGDPMDPNTKIGPQARKDFVDNIDRQVKQTIADGARLVMGGNKIEGPSNLYEITVLADIKRNHHSWNNEIFGPVFSIAKGSTNDELIDMANDSDYGLSSSIYTGNPEATAAKYAGKIVSGNVGINCWTMNAFDFRLPFGGCKQSGIGRECGLDALREFVNEKAYYIKL
jgi:succinate-semialdehyde dehydrogenase